MKNNYSESAAQQNGELVATFGQAKLVRVNKRFELRGGLPDDRFEAREWASMFLREAVFGITGSESRL